MPGEPLTIAEVPPVAGTFEALRTLAILGTSVAVLVVLARRQRAARGVRRRALLTVLVSALLLLPAFLAFQFARRLLDVDAATLDALSWPLVAARVLFTLAFVVALAQSEIFAGAALRRLLAHLATRPSLIGWQAAVADDLDDPTLRIGYPHEGGYRDATGAQVRPGPVPERLWATVEREDRVVAARDAERLQLEAMQNAVKHAGGGATTTVRLVAAGDGLASSSPTTASASTPPGSSAASDSAGWPTGSRPSAARCA